MTTTVIWDPRRSRPLSNVTSPGPISTRLGVSNALHASQAPKALMQEVPVLTEPFQKVAIDLAGPFERAASGYRFLLTAINLATRYPEAIPLKSATAEEVAEGLLEIFSRHGLPQEILSDQGAQLTGTSFARNYTSNGSQRPHITPQPMDVWRGFMELSFPC